MQAREVLADNTVQGEIEALAGRFGISGDEARAVVASVLPEVTRKLEQMALSRGGVADLVAMLGEVQGGGSDLSAATGIGRGNALLEQVFGNRDGSRAAASRASYASGIGDGIIKAMLPYIIQMVLGSFARRASGGLGDILSKIPNLGGGSSAPSMPGGSAPLPRAGSGSPLPGPEGMEMPGRNPYGDLSDIIRRGGSSGGTAAGGGTLWRIVRGIIGTALGFQSRGVISWILRYVVMRFGASILRTIFRRVVTGR